MTFREKLAQSLFDHGLWPDEAEAVLGAMAEDESAAKLVGVLGRQVEEYPETAWEAAWATTKRAAVEWIDANKFRHFVRTILRGIP